MTKCECRLKKCGNKSQSILNLMNKLYGDPCIPKMVDWQQESYTPGTNESEAHTRMNNLNWFYMDKKAALYTLRKVCHAVIVDIAISQIWRPHI